MAREIQFDTVRVKELQKRLRELSEDVNLLRQQTSGSVGAWPGQLPAQEQAGQALSLISRLTDEAERLTELVGQTLRGVEKTKRESRMNPRTWAGIRSMFRSIQRTFAESASRVGALARRVAGIIRDLVHTVKDAATPDPWDGDPVIHRLRERLQNGSPGEKKQAEERLKAIALARETIGRAQTAWEVYHRYGNTDLMELAHREAERNRALLKQWGVEISRFNREVDLKAFYRGSSIQACSYDPSYFYTDGRQRERIEMPNDNQYKYLLSLALKDDGKGQWAKEQLRRIHELFAELGRSQQAWHEYMDRGMHDRAEAAHGYANGLRDILTEQYHLNAELIRTMSFLPYWNGPGFAGEHLRKPPEAAAPGGSGGRIRELLEEAAYWVGRIPYCMDGTVTTRKLDRSNPPPYMDCSDFTSSVFLTVAGIDIGVNTRAQIKQGTAVPYEDLQPGDLVFFDYEKDGVPNHVGIYMGDGKFIHEVGTNQDPDRLKGSTENVKIAEFSTYWRKYFLTGRRILEPEAQVPTKPQAPSSSFHGWEFPPEPVIGGASAGDKGLTKLIQGINTMVEKGNSQNAPSYQKYLKAAKAAGSLERYPQYDTEEEVLEALRWDQKKVHKVWEYCRQASEEMGTLVDPRLMMAIVAHEGTGSFNSNFDPRSPKDGGGYIQPDIEKDLANAIKGNVMGKIRAYSHYAEAYNKTVRDNLAEYPGLRGPKYEDGTFRVVPNLFQYVNHSVVRVIWNEDTQSFGTKSYGVYAIDHAWWQGIYDKYEALAGKGAASEYSQYLVDHPVPWPPGLAKPKVRFRIRTNGTNSNGSVGGFPMVEAY